MVTTKWTLPEQFDEYRLVRMLGRGSMGVVFLGHDLVLDRPVAIKFLNAIDANTRARERFLTEARAAARIQHPNVMGIYRVGELEGRLYIIGEYIRGESLNELPRPMPWQEVLKLAVGLARGLACAHRHGVLHRDIKLANAMRSESGEVKLLDFSLAKLLEDAPMFDPMPAASASMARRIAEPAEEDCEAMGQMRLVIGPGGRAEAPPGGPSPAEGADVGFDSTIARVPDRPSLPPRPQPPNTNESSDWTVVGTPYYMAPELWRSQPASRGSDVYALGVLLYILCNGTPPIEGSTTMELARRSQEVAPKPLRSVAPAVDARFAEIVDRCLRPPADRYPSADELCTAFETLALGTGPVEVVRGNPYRGLQAFEARHRAVFFGRGAEIRAVVDRLRAEPFVLVAGDSGVGKSSLCRAGVLPVFAEQALDCRTWTTISLMPGRRPLQTLASALASTLSLQDEPLRALLESEPAELLRMIARRLGNDAGLLLFIDQLEELVTLADRHQLQTVGSFLAGLAGLAGEIPGIRLLATVRGDFLTRVAALPHIGAHINAAIYLLTPLSREGVRDAIVGPARLQDVDFDSGALIDELVTAGAQGSLPLMQFALAELWEARDPATRQITMQDLERIGRVTGALARHADNVVDALPAAQRIAVRRLLMRLVTIEDTRASLRREDLAVGDPAQEAALEALVRGRLVVVREAPDGTVHEITHEALIRSWGTLQRWISEEREARVIRHRLEIAALEWQRLGSAGVGLWNADQLAEGAMLDRESLRRRERDFLTASHAGLRRLRRIKLIALGAAPLLLCAVFFGFRVQQARELAGKVEQQLARAETTLAEAHALQRAADALRTRAFAEFDAPRLAEAERLWSDAQAAAATADQHYRRAIHGFEAVLQLDTGHAAGRERLADALLARALAAETGGRHEIAAELVERLVESSEPRARWDAPGLVSVRSYPAVPVTLARFVPDPATGHHVLTGPEPLPDPATPRSLAQGSYRLSFRLADGQEVHYPFVVRRGQTLDLAVRLPAPEAIPPGFIHVPAGEFLFGTDQEILRNFFITVPEHPAWTDAYLIARHETTYAEWIAYLEAMPPEQRARMLDGKGRSVQGTSIALERSPEGMWSIALAAGEGVFQACAGELLVYGGRPGAPGQDWLAMPVTTINWQEARDYASWLADTGRVPGARMCDEWEWERAARGADRRRYPHGDRLATGDANIDITYARVLEAAGPDMVGSHPASRSPFGLEDAAGNVFEWTLSRLEPGAPLVRGGSFAYEQFASQSVNRLPVSPKLYDSSVGLRLCATPMMSKMSKMLKTPVTPAK